MSKEIALLNKEHAELKSKVMNFDRQKLLQQQIYEEKLLNLNSELNKRLKLENRMKKNDKSKTNDNSLLEKLIEDMKKENTFAMDTLTKNHNKTLEMYEMIIKEMEKNIAEVLNKNGMLNLGLK